MLLVPLSPGISILKALELITEYVFHLFSYHYRVNTTPVMWESCSSDLLRLCKKLLNSFPRLAAYSDQHLQSKSF